MNEFKIQQLHVYESRHRDECYERMLKTQK